MARRVSEILAVSACLALLAGPAQGWGSDLHTRITDTAAGALPTTVQEYLAPERAALARVYCSFPDMNWGCYGQWGGGEGDPAMPRFPDMRREWEISRYCLSDPVANEGHHCPHRAPEVYDLIPRLLSECAAALRAGRFEDGVRFMGALLHYVEDCGSLARMQPLHRTLSPEAERVVLETYVPQALGTTDEEAAAGIIERTRGLVDFTEGQVEALLQAYGWSIARAYPLCAKATMPPEVVTVVDRIRSEKRAEYRAVATECAIETARVCADVMYTILSIAPPPKTPPQPPSPGVNLAVNPSFEEGDDEGQPAGWCVGWFDKADRAGRPVWYRKGTHWGQNPHQGSWSLLLLWAPTAGLEWRQTWPKAIRVAEGQTYHGAAWVKARNPGGDCYFGLQFSNSAYETVALEKCPVPADATAWRQLEVSVEVPPNARWMRVILHSEAQDGAIWFDDIEVTRKGEASTPAG